MSVREQGQDGRMLTGRSKDQFYSHNLGLRGLKSALQALPRQRERLFVEQTKQLSQRGIVLPFHGMSSLHG